MNKLDLIWALEEHNNTLEKLVDRLDELYKKTDLNKVEEKIYKFHIRNKSLKESYDLLKEKIRKSEHKLKEFRFILEEVEKNLYGGTIQDIIELETLNNKKEDLRKEFDNLETILLFLLEDEEEINREINNMDLENQYLRDQLKSLELEYTKLKCDLIEKIKVEEEGIANISKIIPEDSLKKYNNIRKIKHKGIVAVENYICTGCSVRIPTYLGKALKSKEELQFCENCGRILYYGEGW